MHRSQAGSLKVFEPSHKIMVLFVLRKLILQLRMRCHPVAVRCLIFGRTLRLLPYFMCANSEDCANVQVRLSIRWSHM